MKRPAKDTRKDPAPTSPLLSALEGSSLSRGQQRIQNSCSFLRQCNSGPLSQFSPPRPGRLQAIPMRSPFSSRPQSDAQVASTQKSLLA